MSADAAFDFILASIATVLQGVADDGLARFAEVFLPAAYGERLTCSADIELLVRETFPGHPAEAREVAVLADQLVALARQGHAGDPHGGDQ